MVRRPASPLLLMTGEHYAHMTFEELNERICAALRGNRSPVVMMEALLPDGTRRLIRQRKWSAGSGDMGADSEPT